MELLLLVCVDDDVNVFAYVSDDSGGVTCLLGCVGDDVSADPIRFRVGFFLGLWYFLVNMSVFSAAA